MCGVVVVEVLNGWDDFGFFFKKFLDGLLALRGQKDLLPNLWDGLEVNRGEVDGLGVGGRFFHTVFEVSGITPPWRYLIWSQDG